MAKFDLTSRIGQYLDRHLVFPLLEFLSAKQVNYNRKLYCNDTVMMLYIYIFFYYYLYIYIYVWYVT
jgi:Ca2+/Na+ antiporter